MLISYINYYETVEIETELNDKHENLTVCE